MNLKHVTLVNEDEHAWHVQDGKGAFKIAKHGLGHETAKAIAQHFSGGGKVKDEDAPLPVAGESPMDGFQWSQAQGPGLSEPATDSTEPPAPGGGNPFLPSMAGLQSLGSAIGGGVARLTGQAPEEPTAPAAPPAAAPAGQPEPPPQPPPSGLPAFPKMPGAPGALPGIEKQLGASYDAQGKAATDLGNAQADAYISKASMLGQQAKAQQQLFESQQRQFAENDKRIASAASDVAASRIDPNHFMGSQSTGQKIGSVIAMVLGGISAGLTGKDNPVLGIINGQIQRDMEAQKANLETKQGLLRHYMEQGHDMRSAAQLTMGAQQQIWAAKLEGEAAKSSSPIAQAAAQQMAAQLKSSGLAAQQEAHGRTLSQTEQGLSIALKRYEMGMVPAQRAAQLRAEQGAALPTDFLPYLPADRAVVVRGPRGDSVVLANTSKDRDEVADTQQALTALHGSIKVARGLSDKVGIGGTDTQLGNLAKQDLLNAYQAILGRSNAPRGEQEKRLEDALSNPTSAWKTKASINKQLDELEAIARKHAGAAFSARLRGGVKAAAGFNGMGGPNG